MAGTPTDHLANERTFLAWVRTAITVMALGFVVARFGLFLREVAGISTTATPFSDGVGVFLVLAGTAILLLALVRYTRNRSDLLGGRFTPRLGLEYALTGLLAAVGVGLAIYLLWAP